MFLSGVYKIEIDSKQHKVIVTGNVDSGILIKKLIKSGKNADLWTENCDDDEKKTEQGENADGKLKGDDTSGDEEKGGAPEPAPHGGGGGGGKKKKKKKKKKNTAFANAGGAPPAAGGGSPPPTGNTGPPEDSNPPNQQVFSYPQFYYPVPEYGVSYSTAPPTASMASSYYTFPLHSYTYCRPYYYPPSPPSDPVMAINRYHGDDETGCLIM